jgi:hypothetical protein
MSQLLAWICLVLVASTTAYGLQLTATAITASAAAASQVSTATLTRRVLIIAVDPVTGDRAQLECHVPSYTFANDVVVVHAKCFSEIARVCA